MTINTLTDAKREIEEALMAEWPYCHNVISCVLRMVGRRWGYRSANKLIDYYMLHERFGINKRQEEARRQRNPATP